MGDLLAAAETSMLEGRNAEKEGGEIEGGRSPALAQDTAAAALAKRARIPKRYLGSATPCHDFDKALDQGFGLYIMGPKGVGKTHLAWRVVLGYLQGHMRPTGFGFAFSRTAKLVPVQDMLEDIRATFDGRGSSSDVIGSYSKIDLLVLDDFGKEIPTEWVRSKLFQIINRRYNDCLPTIVTSQYSPERMVERLSARGGRDDAEAISSRLMEMCSLVALEGCDRRAHLGPGVTGGEQ